VGVDCNDARYNPIKRVPVVVTGNHGCFYNDIVPTLDENGIVKDENGGILGIGAGGRGVGGMAATTGGLAGSAVVGGTVACGSDSSRASGIASEPNDRQSDSTKMLHYCQCKYQADCIATRSKGSRAYNEATIRWQ
jgi:hypothetical protein